MDDKCRNRGERSWEKRAYSSFVAREMTGIVIREAIRKPYGKREVSGEIRRKAYANAVSDPNNRSTLNVPFFKKGRGSL